jgi:DHA2 family multidrug resistance protein
MVQSLFGHDTTGAGLLMAPRGIATMLSMTLVGKISERVDSRLLLALGMILIGGAQWMMTGFSLEMDSQPIIVTGLIQGFGLGFVMIPLNLLAFATIPPKLRTTAASVWSLSRNIGGSITISLFSALLAHNLQVAHSDLAGELSVTRFPILQGGFAEIVGMNTSSVLQFLDAEINRQAMMISYLDDFLLLAAATFILLPVILVVKKNERRPPAEHAMVME